MAKTDSPRMSPSKELDTWKSRRYLGWRCHWVDEEGRFPFSTNNPKTLSKRKMTCSRFSAWQYHVPEHVLSSTHYMQHMALFCCFSNCSVAKVSFKMFSHLRRMLMLQKRQQPTMFLFRFWPNFNEKSRSLEFIAGKYSSIRRILN